MSNSTKTVVKELVEYFEQQLSLHRSSEIKYTTEEAWVDAIQVCKNALKTKEQEQLQDAFDNRQANWDAKCQDYKDGKDYYSKTFKKSIPVNLDFKDSICEGCGNYNMQCTCYQKSKDDHFNGLR